MLIKDNSTHSTWVNPNAVLARDANGTGPTVGDDVVVVGVETVGGGGGAASEVDDGVDAYVGPEKFVCVIESFNSDIFKFDSATADVTFNRSLLIRSAASAKSFNCFIIDSTNTVTLSLLYAASELIDDCASIMPSLIVSSEFFMAVTSSAISPVTPGTRQLIDTNTVTTKYANKVVTRRTLQGDPLVFIIMFYLIHTVKNYLETVHIKGTDLRYYRWIDQTTDVISGACNKSITTCLDGLLSIGL